MEEWNKERVKSFLSAPEGVVMIRVNVQFVEFNPEKCRYEKKISDEIFTKVCLTTEMLKATTDASGIFDMEFRNMGRKVYNLIESINNKEVSK